MLKRNFLIHAKLPIFINSRKFIHAKISTFTVSLLTDLVNQSAVLAQNWGCLSPPPSQRDHRFNYHKSIVILIQFPYKDLNQI